MKRNLLPVLSLLLAIAAASVAVAQSGNRDHPTPIDSNELRGVLNSDGGEFFYSFTAGPGDLTITVEVKSTGGTLAMPFELLGANAADSILCCEFAQAGRDRRDGTRREDRQNQKPAHSDFAPDREPVRGRHVPGPI